MYCIGDEEIEALKKLFDRKRFYRYQSTYESECDLFEAEFSTLFNTNHSILLSSGTNALILALLSAGIRPGDEVLIPTYTFVATASAVIHAGAIPVLVNINSDLSLDIEDARAKITDKTKALILVHMDGLVADIAGATQLCREKSLIFVEDVAQAIGASFENKRLGTFGDFGCYSLNENKNITCGEGGILVTSNRTYFEKAFCLHDGPAQFNPTKKDFFKEIEPFMGLSMRVSEIQGTIMRVQLKRLDHILNELRVRKKIFLEQLSHLPSARVVTGYSAEGDCSSSLHLQFDDPSFGAQVSKTLREKALLFAPITIRPAHAAWKWSHLLGEKSHVQPGLNPYHRTEKSYSYPTYQYLDSVEILTKTVKMDIDINKSLSQTEEEARVIRSVITNG
jgi:dTDP-4-amino-4,6-dideoxygalactose transaminase